MKIEYEATFINIDKDEIRERLKNIGAQLARPEFLQKRCTFNLPAGHEINGGWVRVLDTGEKYILTLKIVDGSKIENQKEINIEVGNFVETIEFLEKIGCNKKAYQETKRELWLLDDVEVTIDEWPFLEPYVEIEGKSEDEVRKVSEKIGLDYASALFCCVSTLYSKKYNISEEIINNQIPEITFEGKNPFLK